MTRHLRRLALLTVLALAACGGEDAPAPVDAPTPPQAAVEPEAPATPAPVVLDETALREAARRALAEQRLYSPAEDNAIDHYLALRERHPAEAGLQEALVDLAPYALIATERAIAAGELEEGERLAGQLASIDPTAPALPRLRGAIEDARAERADALAEAERREEAASAAAAAAAAQPTAAPAPAPPAASPPPAATPAVAEASAPPAPPPPAPPITTPITTPPPSPPPVTAAPPPPQEPRAIATPAPRYPPQAQRRRIEGEVRLMFTVGVDGSVSGVEVESATPPEVFDREAVSAVSRWRFEPMQAPVRVRRTLRFRLPDAR